GGPGGLHLGGGVRPGRRAPGGGGLRLAQGVESTALTAPAPCLFSLCSGTIKCWKLAARQTARSGSAPQTRSTSRPGEPPRVVTRWACRVGGTRPRAPPLFPSPAPSNRCISPFRKMRKRALDKRLACIIYLIQ